jgi:hypothetical protein
MARGLFRAIVLDVQAFDAIDQPNSVAMRLLLRPAQQELLPDNFFSRSSQKRLFRILQSNEYLALEG